MSENVICYNCGGVMKMNNIGRDGKILYSCNVCMILNKRISDIYKDGHYKHKHLTNKYRIMNE